MNIAMVTNTYKPIMGGLEKSIEEFSKRFRSKGHRVIIIAPDFEKAEPEKDVIRIAAIQNFSGTDFSIQVPIPGALEAALGDVKPDLVHSHHPFLIGDTALRLAHKHNVPLVFTHHTLYEQNTHYVPGDSDAMKQFVIQLATGYANLADTVFAPSESVMELIRQRGVTTNIQVVPTGIEVEDFAKGDWKMARQKAGIPADAFVVGQIGRLAPEKNLEFVATVSASFLKKKMNAHFLMVGKGPSEDAVKAIFEKAGVSERLHLTGPLSGQDLIDAYHAMDVFAFASQSETQGLVLTEAMAAGTPVVGVDAPGVREVVKDKVTGRLLPKEDEALFLKALEWMAALSADQSKTMRQECRRTASDFSMDTCAARALSIYEELVQIKDFARRPSEDSPWAQTVRLIQTNWDVMKNLTKAGTEALLNPNPDQK